jgi:two-component system LytT family sensor kinase
MKRQIINKFFILLTHFIFKAGDQSFGDFFDFTLRGFIFSTFFVSYWLLVWYIAAYIHQKLLAKQDSSIKIKTFYTFSIIFFHFSYGLLVSLLLNWLYRFGDIQFFSNSDVWSEIPFLNPELTFSLLMIYIMIFSFDTYLQVNIRRKEDQIQLGKLKQENTLAKYLNLKAQIEPHFLFNSLSVLSSIIYSDVDLASDFTLRLSKILRYVIEKNELLLVPLKDEITFINDYFFLIKTRFEDGIVFENRIDESNIDNYNIPPVSIQLLIENAIKHNKFTNDKPLFIELYNDDNFLIIKNNINLRDDIIGTTKQGLENLSKRFSFLSEKPVRIEMTENEFIVSLPLLSIKDNESFNI